MTNVEWQKYYDELAALAEMATPGPWKWDSGNMEVESQHEAHWRLPVATIDNISDRMEHLREFGIPLNPPDVPRDYCSDGEFISESITAIPKLLARIRKLEMMVAAVRDARNELGVPQPGYPAPVANAANYLAEALAALEES